MARDFKMHRAGPARSEITPLGGGRKRPSGRERLPQTDSRGQDPSDGPVAEIGGPKGPEPTRYGDWERNGICYDF